MRDPREGRVLRRGECGAGRQIGRRANRHGEPRAWTLQLCQAQESDEIIRRFRVKSGKFCVAEDFASLGVWE